MNTKPIKSKTIKRLSNENDNTTILFFKGNKINTNYYIGNTVLVSGLFI